MSSKFEVDKKTVSNGDLISDLVYMGSLTTLDISSKKEVYDVTNKKTGDTVRFNDKDSAVDYIKSKTT
jgi:hypothetical protein